MPPAKLISVDEAIQTARPSSATPASNLFRENELLTGINDFALQAVSQRIEVVKFKAQEVIFEEEETGDSLYLIAHGSVKISKRGRGGQQETLAYLMERDFFGEMALVDRGKRSAQAAAVGETVLGKIDRSGWDRLLQLAPHEVLNNFTRAITKRLRDNNQHFIEEMMRNERLSLLGTTISSIMHDMNNPIACIRASCTLLESGMQNPLTDRVARMIREAVEKMEMMARELVDFSRGKTRLHLQPLNLPDLLKDLEPDFARARERVEVIVEMLYDGSLRADRHRLLRVFGNLIRNACEAMTDGGAHKLRFTVERADSSVRFEVSDTGCGIPSELLPRIFEPFTTQGKANGTGLGLALSKAVVEAHKGTISVQSNEKGAVFQIDLPLGS